MVKIKFTPEQIKRGRAASGGTPISSAIREAEAKTAPRISGGFVGPGAPTIPTGTRQFPTPLTSAGVSSFTGKTSTPTTPTTTQKPTAPTPTAPTKPTTLAPTAPVTPTKPTAPTVTRPTTPVQAVVSERAGVTPEKDKLIERLTAAVSGVEAFKPSERFAELQAERGVPGQREEIGTLEEEIVKTTSLLDTIEADLKEGVGEFIVPESKFNRLLARERDPLIKQLGTLTDSLGILESRLGREERDILDVLGLELAEAGRPLDILQQELETTGTIQDLTEDETIKLEDALQRQREGSIIGVLAQGILDPAQIFDLVNFDEEGNQVGDIGINEIVETLGSINSIQQATQAIDTAELQNRLLESQIANQPLEANKIRAEIAKLQADTAKTRSDILGTTGAGGLRESILSLSAGQQEGAFASIQTMKNAKDILDLIEEGIETGPAIGRLKKGISAFGVPIVPGLQSFGLSSEQTNRFIALTTAFAANFIKSISGVAVSAQEFERLTKALPDINRQETVNKDSILALTNTIRNKYELQLGVNFDDFPEQIPNLAGPSGAEADLLASIE